MPPDMPAESRDSIHARAIEWHLRLRDGDDAIWESFAQWLAADPLHAQAYDLIEQTDLALEPLLPDLVIREAANDSDDPAETPARRTGWMLLGGALVASVALALVLVPQSASSRYEVVTRPGERQSVRLDQATEVTLNGATRMTFDRDDPRFASLTQGEALFHVRHDSNRPFRLEVGENIVEDAGTIFNVVRDAGEVRVAVAEGKVVYNPRGAAVALAAGRALVDRDGSPDIQVSDVPVQRVGSWKTGSLVYAATALSQVAADLGRALGLRLTVAPAIADRPFSGTIMLDGSGPEQLARLKLALNVELDQGPDGWVMKPSGRARP